MEIPGKMLKYPEPALLRCLTGAFPPCCNPEGCKRKNTAIKKTRKALFSRLSGSQSGGIRTRGLLLEEIIPVVVRLWYDWGTKKHYFFLINVLICLLDSSLT